MKIILVGKAGCGKDHIRKMLQKKGGRYGISSTTRKKRPNEIQGVDYLFYDNPKFEEFINNGQMLQYCEFNGSYYGTEKIIFDTNDIFIMSPEGISKLSEDARKMCTIIFIECDENVRVERMINRAKGAISEKEIEKRLEADNLLFKNFVDYDLVVINDGSKQTIDLPETLANFL